MKGKLHVKEGLSYIKQFDTVCVFTCSSYKGSLMHGFDERLIFNFFIIQKSLSAMLVLLVMWWLLSLKRNH